MFLKIATNPFLVWTKLLNPYWTVKQYLKDFDPNATGQDTMLNRRSTKNQLYFETFLEKWLLEKNVMVPSKTKKE